MQQNYPRFFFFIVFFTVFKGKYKRLPIIWKILAGVCILGGITLIPISLMMLSFPMKYAFLAFGSALILVTSIIHFIHICRIKINRTLISADGASRNALEFLSTGSNGKDIPMQEFSQKVDIEYREYNIRARANSNEDTIDRQVEAKHTDSEDESENFFWENSEDQEENSEDKQIPPSNILDETPRHTPTILPGAPWFKFSQEKVKPSIKTLSTEDNKSTSKKINKLGTLPHPSNYNLRQKLIAVEETEELEETEENINLLE